MSAETGNYIGIITRGEQHFMVRCREGQVVETPIEPLVEKFVLPGENHKPEVESQVNGQNGYGVNTGTVFFNGDGRAR